MRWGDAWQDTALMAGGLVLLVALIPSVLATSKPALATSLLTTSVLALMGLVHLSLGLRRAAVIHVVTAATWAVLAMQAL